MPHQETYSIIAVLQKARVAGPDGHEEVGWSVCAMNLRAAVCWLELCEPTSGLCFAVRHAALAVLDLRADKLISACPAELYCNCRGSHQMPH